MFGGRDQGFSGPELYEIFSRYTDELGSYPREGGAPSRWRIVELGLSYLPFEDQIRVLEEMCCWDGAVRYARPAEKDLDWLRDELAALRSREAGDEPASRHPASIEGAPELSPELVSRAASMFGGRTTGFSGPELYAFFSEYTDELGEYPGSGAPSRWQVVEWGLALLPSEQQIEVLEAMACWKGPMKYGPPAGEDLEWLGTALAESRASLDLSADLSTGPAGAQAARAADLWTSDLHRVKTDELLARLEDQELEYKESARVNVRTKEIDKKVEQAWIKAIAGLWNQEGGVVVIGIVDRSNKVVGVNLDLRHGSLQDEDALRNWITNQLCNHLAEDVAARVKVRLDPIEEKKVIRIDVPRGPEPIFLDDQDFIVRMDNSTRKLTGNSMLRYEKQRWPAN